ncbi:MAG: hypothetical protein BM485_16995 [Desulfobulbaceae bacterium DB1]|nr:MAG: hypothetical protein BM485_16995 [Desulfobulbaceae bacterium DB1]
MLPEVLDRAAKSLGIDDAVNLRGFIQVEYGLPTTDGIQKKYRNKLEAKNLSTADIAQINREFEEEMQRLSESGLRITINHAALGLPPADGATLAYALPRAWTEVFSEKYRVFVDTRLSKAAVNTTANPFTSTADILLARHALVLMRDGLDILAKDNRFKSIVNESGLGSSDLQSELDRFSQIYFSTIFSSMFAHPDLVAASFLVETQLQIDEISRNIEEIDRGIADLRNFQPQATGRQMSAGANETVQFGDNSLRQVIDLANQASLADYMRELLAARRDLVAKRAGLLKEISRNQVKSDISDNKDFLKQASAMYSILVEGYDSFLTVAHEVARQKTGDFYRPMGIPYVNGSILPLKGFLILALAVILGGMSAMLMALVWPDGAGVKGEGCG